MIRDAPLALCSGKVSGIDTGTVFDNQCGENCSMKEFLKNHWDDILVYGFGALMVVAGVMFCCIIVA